MPTEPARARTKTPARKAVSPTKAKKSAAKTTATTALPADTTTTSPTTRKQLMENEVLEHATRLFAERGFNGTSLQDVATSMGLKRPALYYYFKSKDELLDRLIDRAVTDPTAQLRAIAARAELDPAERLRAITRAIVTFTLTNTDLFLLLVKSESELSQEARERFDESRREATEVVTAVIEEGIASGVFRPVDARIAAFSVYGISNWAAWWYRPDGPDSLESVADQLADIAAAGLQRPGDKSNRAVTTKAAIAELREGLDRLEQSLDYARRG